MHKGKNETLAQHRKMSNRLIVVFMALVLAVVALIGSTLAYLMDKTESVVNTFTYGDINITLEETQGTLLRDTTRQFKMMPGEPISKDPIITVKAGSEACWLYVKLEKSDNFDQFMTYDMAEGWTKLPGYDDVFCWNEHLNATVADTEYQVIAGNIVNVKPEVTKAQLNTLNENTMPTLTVTAYAVQYSSTQETLNSGEAAWKQVPQEVSSLDELREALNKGGIVTLTDNIWVDEQLVVSQPTTLELNGKTIAPVDGKIIFEGDNWSLISVDGPQAELTINGNGKFVTAPDDSYTVDVRNGGKLTINGGEYVGNIHAVYVHAGELVVNGGKFSVQQQYPDVNKAYEFTLNCWDTNRANGTARITVNGGDFYKFNPADCQAEGEHTRLTGADATVTQNGDWYTVTK